MKTSKKKKRKKKVGAMKEREPVNREGWMQRGPGDGERVGGGEVVGKARRGEQGS